MDQTTVASIYLGSVGGSEIDLRALLMLVEYTTFPTNKKPTNVGLDESFYMKFFKCPVNNPTEGANQKYPPTNQNYNLLNQLIHHHLL